VRTGKAPATSQAVGPWGQASTAPQKITPRPRADNDFPDHLDGYVPKSGKDLPVITGGSLAGRFRTLVAEASP
jgi:hypothetical protein